MKALTIYQPWATLIMIGAKPYEFRTRSYRGYPGRPAVGDRIAIHASARRIKLAEIEDLIDRVHSDQNTTGLIPDLAEMLLANVRDALKRKRPQPLPLGALLGTAVLGPPRRADEVFGLVVEDSDRGQFNWAWPLVEIVRFYEPIPARGLQGFWNCGGVPRTLHEPASESQESQESQGVHRGFR